MNRNQKTVYQWFNAVADKTIRNFLINRMVCEENLCANLETAFIIGVYVDDTIDLKTYGSVSKSIRAGKLVVKE